MADAECPSLDLSTTCPVYNVKGKCDHGFKCRFLGGHVRKDDVGSNQWQVMIDEDKRAHSAVTETELNFIGPNGLRQVRSKKVCLDSCAKYHVLNLP